jgi:hypothetical protein
MLPDPRRFFNLFSQEIQFNTNFTSDTVLFPFENIDIISSMTIEGDIHLHNDTSLVSILYDISGKLVFSKKINKWQKSIDINTDELKQGAYLLIYIDNTGYSQSKKLIISN